MKHFAGLEVQPVSHITHYPSCKIDRTMVKGYKTVFGDAVFEVIGGQVGADTWVPLCRGTHCFDDAWAVKIEFDRRIDAALREAILRRREADIRFRGDPEA